MAATAVAFDAAADSLKDQSSTVPVSNTSYTVCGWVRRKSGNQDPAVLFESDASGTTTALALNNQAIGILNEIGFSWPATVSGQLTVDTWYFVAMTISGTSGVVYRGTESSGVTSASGTVASQGATFRIFIGGTSSAFYPTADLCLWRIWNAVLTSTELDAERVSLTPVRTSNLTRDYRLAAASTKLVDSSSNAANLTAVGAGPWQDVSDGPAIGSGGGAVLAGAVSSAATGTGALTTSIRLAGAVSATATSTGALTTSIRLAGAVSATATVAGALTTSIPLGGSISSGATVAGALTTSIPLGGAVSATATVAGALTTSIRLAGSASASANTAGSLGTAIPLSGAVSASATVTGSFSGTAAQFLGAVSVSATATGAITTLIPLGGFVGASSAPTGALTASIPLAGSTGVSASATGTLTTAVALGGAVSVSATSAGVLTTTIQLAGASTVNTTAAGALMGTAIFTPPYSAPGDGGSSADFLSGPVIVSMHG